MPKKVARRGPPVRVAPRPAEPLQTVGHYYQPMEAHMARARLEDSGIKAFLSNEFIAITDSPIASVTGGVQVRVRQSEAARAALILRDG